MSVTLRKASFDARAERSNETRLASGSQWRALSLPFPLDESHLPHSIAACGRDEAPDFVIINDAASISLLASALSPAAAAIVPVVDATGISADNRVKRRSDLSIGMASPRALSEALITLSPMIARIRQLSPAIFQAADPRLLLLARLFVRDSDLLPSIDPAAKDAFVYRDEAAVDGAVTTAEDLVGNGLLERRFFDAVAACPHCACSARLVVRELCASCGSPHVTEQAVLHHLSCAYQGPESDFRQETGGLICPKCRQALTFFSLDYDRPGSLYICHACGHSSGDIRIELLCLNCGASIAAGDMSRQDFYRYSLTDAARALVISPAPKLPPSSPDQGMIGAVRAFADRLSSRGAVGCILKVRLHEPPGTPPAGRNWQQTWSFFRSLLRECFVQDTEIVEELPVFLVMIESDAKRDVERALPEISSRLERHLSLAPSVEYAVLTCTEFLALAAANSNAQAPR
ncbi:hypothetical protein [Methylocystis iwaonis]|uniref:TackOD1 domain-containing metal-binding protein n=1 Tax=Methylocystis iwaonis TaxID=2885079 RepID=UPI00249129CB|nr:hypothetical protein [Methylocystis iwaonis]